MTDSDESGSVARADVAAVIAATLVEPRTVGRAIRFNGADGPAGAAIADALRG